MIFQIDWIGSKKMKQTFFKFQSVTFLMERNNCVSFLHTIRLVASLSKQTFPKHVTVTCYETPILYNRTFFSTNLMKNSHSFWTSNFHKECGRFDKKEHLAIVSVFGWKNLSHHQPCGINNDVFKNFNCVALPYEKKLEISTKIFWTNFCLETFRWLI